MTGRLKQSLHWEPEEPLSLQGKGKCEVVKGSLHSNPVSLTNQVARLLTLLASVPFCSKEPKRQNTEGRGTE